MDYRQLGRSGVQVSVIGLGANQFGGRVDQAGATAIVNTALELGINFIDTADVYQGARSEQTLGVALKGRWREVVLATKFRHKVGPGPNDQGASRYHLMHALEDSLRRLQRDHIDLYQVHRWDDTTPIEETLRALDDLVRDGKVRYVGASNFAAWQLARSNLLAELRGWSPFVTIQPQYHLLEREVEKELLPFCRAHHVGILPYFPLAAGFLTGRYRRGEPPPPGSRGENSPYIQRYMTDANYDLIERLSAWATERGRSLAELAHAWLLAHPEVCSVISGASQPEHVRSNAKAADWTLTAAELQAIEAMLNG